MKDYKKFAKFAFTAKLRNGLFRNMGACMAMAVDYATLKKGGFMRQKQKNNFSLRLRVVGGNLTAKQLATIAEVSDKYGEGYVHLTSRQSVEIPFIKLDDIEEVKRLLQRAMQSRACADQE